MPNTLEAVLVFGILIVPGYQLVRGYAVARSDAPPSTQLYVLAQAVVASLAWLCVTWPVVNDLLRWIRADSLSDHALASYLTIPLFLGTPYLIGRVLGRLVVAITRSDNRRGPDWLRRVADAAGLVERGTAWDLLWLRAVDNEVALVTVALDDGTSLHGQFGDRSRVMASPAAPSVYFERAYETDPATGRVVAVYGGGAHIDGARIVALKLQPLP